MKHNSLQYQNFSAHRATVDGRLHTEELQAEFILTELDLGLTFCDMGEIARLRKP
jgi:hypothetical protein